MHRHSTKRGDKRQRVNRIALVARVQLAYEQFTDAVARLREGAPHGRRAVALARHRLRLLNRAMAMMALSGNASAA